ncbi:MAG: hypothetical protein US31_C0007G0027 [Berkelbacteria bacterium GW2011_GWA1_36_9]|uniref:DUF2207 domain-containing protein n=1 Tax=Berkelbacteria bacterium GW2011_GWA1_36_9 TaxID=1618331 RepID=A0A0G0IQE7_9BACT|nr:MAG: hypothetical protein US31_C0007G0027 [Berkelbacteria bacterium GW2011_GWA1_36_9]
MKKILFILIGILLFIPITVSAQETERILSFSEKITVNADSTINVSEEIRYFFPSEKHGIYRDIPYRYLDKERKKYFQTDISDIKVTNETGNPYQFTSTEKNNNLRLQVGDPNKTISGEHIYKISYKVSGVLNYFSDHDELYWNVTGDSWTVPIDKITAEITLPQNVLTEKIQATCYTGETGSTSSNCNQDISKNQITFQSSQSPLTIVVGWNKGAVTPIERRYEAQWRHESFWFLLLPLFVLIFLIIQYFRLGRDPFGRGTIAPEFEPPENLKPAEMSSLINEKVSNKDMSATIIDFAVRGLIKIKEKDKKYTLIKLKEFETTAKDYEKEIFIKLFSENKEVEVDSLYKNFTDLKKVKNKLYQDLISRKYFSVSPDKIRSHYLLVGFLIMFLGFAFFWLSVILVFALAMSGFIVIIFARFMPRKTKEAVIVKEKSLGFKEFLFRAERYRVKWQEKEGIFEKYLPYAMIFGIAEIWAKNFKDIYKNPPDWYEGNFTTFNAVIFANSLNSFSTTATQSFSPPAASGSSGFGGGSSGGGFGGGGGGSW